jgi:hypothetical protein
VIPEDLAPWSEFDRGPLEPARLADGTTVKMPTTEVFLSLPGCRAVRLTALISTARSEYLGGVLVGHDYMEAAEVLPDPAKRTFRCRRQSSGGASR